MKMMAGDFAGTQRINRKCIKCRRMIKNTVTTAQLRTISANFLKERALQGKNTPNVWLESSGGSHYTDNVGTGSLNFGSVQAGSQKTLKRYIDNEASGSPTDDLDDWTIDGIAGSTQYGSTLYTYNAMEFGSPSGSLYDPFTPGSMPADYNPLPAEGDGSARRGLDVRWSPPGGAATGTFRWGLQVSGVYT